MTKINGIEHNLDRKEEYDLDQHARQIISERRPGYGGPTYDSGPAEKRIMAQLDRLGVPAGDVAVITTTRFRKTDRVRNPPDLYAAAEYYYEEDDVDVVVYRDPEKRRMVF